MSDRVTGNVQTTDATETTVTGATYALPDASMSQVEATVTARQPSDGDSKTFRISAGVKRHGGGGATIVGAVVNVFAAQGDAGATTWLATVDVSGNDVRVRVTGELATTIEWAAALSVTRHTP